MLLAHSVNDVLLDGRMADGSRHFASLPEKRSWRALQRHIAKLPSVALGELVSDGVSEVWFDFRFEGHDFTVNNQLGEYWFFVRDPSCTDSVLHRVADHCSLFLSSHSVISTVADTVRDAVSALRSTAPSHNNRNI